MGGGMNNWMNNPFAYLMFLALFRNGGFGFGDGNGAGIATQGIETQAQLNAIRTQLQDNQNANCIKSAIQGNGFALSQLAQTLNIDFNTLQKCCCDVQAAIQQVAGQVGFSAERVINAGNLILSTDKMSLASEIEAMKNTAEQILASVDHQKEVLEKSSSLLAELNPVYKEKQETEKRFSAIEETVTGVKGSVDELKKMMSDFIKKMS